MLGGTQWTNRAWTGNAVILVVCEETRNGSGTIKSNPVGQLATVKMKRGSGGLTSHDRLKPTTIKKSQRGFSHATHLATRRFGVPFPNVHLNNAHRVQGPKCRTAPPSASSWPETNDTETRVIYISGLLFPIRSGIILLWMGQRHPTSGIYIV